MTELDYELFLWVWEDQTYLLNMLAIGITATWFFGLFIFEQIKDVLRYWPSKDFMADVL